MTGAGVILSVLIAAGCLLPREARAATPGAVAFQDISSDPKPKARDDAASTLEGTPVTIDVLANDTGEEGDSLWVARVKNAEHGVVINNVTSVTYTPDPGFIGPDRFDYTVSNAEGETAEAKVTIVVIAQP